MTGGATNDTSTYLPSNSQQQGTLNHHTTNTSKAEKEKKKMLKTNSKQAKEAVKKYILDSFNPYDYNELSSVDCEDFGQVATAILSTFYAEKKHDCHFRAGRCSLFDLFRDWCAGLPDVIGGCWYYNEDSIDLVGSWLQETETEKERYTYADAEKLIDTLIYRELTSAAADNWKGGAYYDN